MLFEVREKWGQLCPKHFEASSVYIYIYIILGYNVLQSTRALCALRSIINFMSEMIDQNRSI
jgi:hypothetical protein